MKLIYSLNYPFKTRPWRPCPKHHKPVCRFGIWRHVSLFEADAVVRVLAFQSRFSRRYGGRVKLQCSVVGTCLRSNSCLSFKTNGGGFDFSLGPKSSTLGRPLRTMNLTCKNSSAMKTNCSLCFTRSV